MYWGGGGRRGEVHVGVVRVWGGVCVCMWKEVGVWVCGVWGWGVHVCGGCGGWGSRGSQERQRKSGVWTLNALCSEAGSRLRQK